MPIRSISAILVILSLAGCGAMKQTVATMVPDAAKSPVDMVLDEGRGDKAMYDQLLSMVDDNPTDVGLQEALALCAWRMGDTVKAVRHGDVALDYDRESRVATEVVLLAAGRDHLPKKVESTLRMAPRSMYEDSGFLLNAGYALLSVDDAENAAVLFKQAVALDPDEKSYAAFSLACVLADRVDVAQRELSWYLPPHRIQAILGAAELKASKKDPSKASDAATHFKKAASLSPVGMPAAENGLALARGIVDGDKPVMMLLVGIDHDRNRSEEMAKRLGETVGARGGIVWSKEGYGIMVGPFPDQETAIQAGLSVPGQSVQAVTVKADLVEWAR